VPHPSPAKAKQFREIDLLAARESVRAIAATTIRHFIYLSVAHPAPVMKESRCTGSGARSPRIATRRRGSIR
jgi:hypothetical protein